MMSWLKRFSSPFRRAGRIPSTKILSAETIFGGILAGIDLSKLEDYESYLKAGSKNIWAAFKCCDVCGKTAMDTPLYVTRKNGDGTPVQVPGLSELLAEPSDFYTMAEMVYLWAFHIKLTGNAYWAKDQANLTGDRPLRLLPMNPKRVQLVVDGTRGVTGYIYNVNGVQIPWDVSEVIHFRNPHPNNDVYGLGDVEAGTELFQDQLNRQGYSSRFWKNGAAPSGVLIHDELITDQTQFELAKKRWTKDYGGPENSGKTAWLTGKWKYEKLGLSAVEMQSLENTKHNLESICHVMGVPLSVIGMRDAANFATARVDEMIFRRYTIKPLLKILTSTLQTDLVAGYGPNFEMRAEISGLVDAEAITQNMAPWFDRGAVSINEIRGMLGLAPKDDPLFESHFLSAGLVPLDLAGIGPAGDSAQAAARAIVDRFISGVHVVRRDERAALETRVKELSQLVNDMRESGAELSTRQAEAMGQLTQSMVKLAGDLATRQPQPPAAPVPAEARVALDLTVKSAATKRGPRTVTLTEKDGVMTGKVEGE